MCFFFLTLAYVRSDRDETNHFHFDEKCIVHLNPNEMRTKFSFSMLQFNYSVEIRNSDYITLNFIIWLICQSFVDFFEY